MLVSGAIALAPATTRVSQTQLQLADVYYIYFFFFFFFFLPANMALPTPVDRPLSHINKKGRPVSQCPHCRGLRKARTSHAKCECGEKPHSKAECPLNGTAADGQSEYALP